MVMMPMTLGDP